MESVAAIIIASFHAESQKKKGKRNKYFILYEAIKGSILKADLPSEVALTPSRTLAEDLSLSRSTVLKAYELLVLEGYLISVQGSGYKIKAIDFSFDHNRPQIDPEIAYPKLSDTANAFMNNVGQLNSTDDKSVGFRPGLPPLDIFPVNQWKNLSNTYWRYIKSSALSYSPSSGNEQLKKNLVTYLNLSRGIKCESSQIIIVSGSLQSLYLLGSILMNPGDTILVENPTFPNVKSIFKSLRAKMLGIEVDEQGICVDQMESVQHRSAKLIHVTPSNQYPKGIQMSMERRKGLLDWANRNHSIIVENDYEHEVNNYSESLPSLFSLDQEERTVFLGTFNRLLHPSIRIGYMVLPPYLIAAVEALLKHSHRFVAPSIQVVLNQFIEKKFIYNHIKRVVEVADQRKQDFIQIYQELLGKQIPLHLTNIRSLHLMAQMPNELSDQELCRLLEQKHILVHAYSKCFVQDSPEQGLIFGYSSIRQPVMNRKLVAMSEVVKDLNWYVEN